MINYRVLQTVEELKQVEHLEMLIWGLNPIDAVPMYVMHAAALNGGLVLGAYDGAQMVGMAYGFTAKRGSEIYLWSHMTGVHPAYQSQGVGYGLKQTQRRWALENGYEIIRWTYDPLQRGNAHFNIARLGTIAKVYHENFYGDMDDDINRGLPSDRAEAEWHLRAPRGSEFKGALPASLILIDENGAPEEALAKIWDLAAYFIPLPPSLPTLEHSQRLAWRMSVRHALQAAFTAGYVVTGFSKDACGYVVERVQV
jgi:predicted GNAT superfamily acetyltransferase